MQKFISQLLGIFIFIFLMFYAIGFTYAYNEQSHFINHRNDILALIEQEPPENLSVAMGVKPHPNYTGPLTKRDGTPLDEFPTSFPTQLIPINNETALTPNLQEALKKFNTTFRGEGFVSIQILEDRTPNNVLSMGDRLNVNVTATGSGRFGFRIPKQRMRDLETSGKNRETNRLHLVSNREVTVGHRNKSYEKTRS